MELRTLRYFLTVCQEGTMSRAADVLHVTQPALSRQIAALERELGTPLLERHARSVTPTERGLYLRRRAEEIVGLADQTTADFTQPDEIVAGDIHIGAGESEGISVVARAARAFRARHPGVRFHLHSGTAIDLIERLEHGVDDFAVLMSYTDIDRYDHLRLHQLYAHIAGPNVASLRLFEASGFVRCGHLSQWIVREGGYADVVVMQRVAGTCPP